jgi:hypothetical protein
MCRTEARDPLEVLLAVDDLNKPSGTILRRRMLEIFGQYDQSWWRFFVDPRQLYLTPIPRAAAAVRTVRMDERQREALLVEVAKVQKERKPRTRTRKGEPLLL